MYMYSGVSAVAFLTAILFWFTFHHYDKQERQMNELDADDSEWKHKNDDSSEAGSVHGQQEQTINEKL